MCYSPPGPRCSHHAHQELMKAVRRFDAEQNPNRKLLLQEKVELATEAYYSTPRGMNDLRREIALLLTESRTNPEVIPTLTDKRILLRKGELTRKTQLEAFFAMQANRNSSVKEVLQTGNKQKQAVGILFNRLVQFEPQVKVHVNDDRTVEVFNADNNILILAIPQRQQSLITTVKQNDDGTFASTSKPVPTEVLALLKKYDSFMNIPPKDKALLENWVVEELRSENVSLFCSVDVKTENVLLKSIDEVFQVYDLEFKKKPKLGGTSSYKYGATEELLEELAAVNLTAEVTTVSGKETKTVLFNLSYLPTAKQQHLGKFFLAEGITDSGEKFYEVRKKHQSKQINVLLELRRKESVILTSNMPALASFLTNALDI